MVGLCVEIRPDGVTVEGLTHLRGLGCTKIQIGIQTLSEEVLEHNRRPTSIRVVKQAFELLRIFGFKTHAHVMLNLPGSTPNQDVHDYERIVTDPAFIPDEVKLYPCVLIKGTRLDSYYARCLWDPYEEEELIETLAADMLATPPYIRVSRVIRDFSAHDIVAGNTKANLRQLVDARIAARGRTVCEIRTREPGNDPIDRDELVLDTVIYKTSNTEEHFLQWRDATNRIGGFLRLSLPDPTYVASCGSELPAQAGEAMIREVHIYGAVARLADDADDEGFQHRGLGRELIEEACRTAAARGFRYLNVISSVGTRAYYRKLGFEDHGLYQRLDLEAHGCHLDPEDHRHWLDREIHRQKRSERS
jgi:elongator complex protein 3